MKITTILYIIVAIFIIMGWLDMLNIKHFPNKEFEERIYNLTFFFMFWIRIEQLLEKKDK